MNLILNLLIAKRTMFSNAPLVDKKLWDLQAIFHGVFCFIILSCVVVSHYWEGSIPILCVSGERPHCRGKGCAMSFRPISCYKVLRNELYVFGKWNITAWEVFWYYSEFQLVSANPSISKPTPQICHVLYAINIPLRRRLSESTMWATQFGPNLDTEYLIQGTSL